MRSRRSFVLSLALCTALGLVAAGCGDEDDGEAIATDEGGDGGASSAGSSGAAGGDAGDGGITIDPMPAGDPNAPVTDDGNAAGGGGGGGQPAGGEARIVNPTPGLNGVVEAALDSAILRDGNKVEARFYGGVADCYGVDRVEVEEADESVTITVFTGSPPEAAARTCIEIAELQAVIVPLGAPLGDRVVIDGSSGAEVPLS